MSSSYVKCVNGAPARVPARRRSKGWREEAAGLVAVQGQTDAQHQGENEKERVRRCRPFAGFRPDRVTRWQRSELEACGEERRGGGARHERGEDGPIHVPAVAESVRGATEAEQQRAPGHAITRDRHHAGRGAVARAVGPAFQSTPIARYGAV